MVKCRMTADEMYPVYYVYTDIEKYDWLKLREVPDALVERYKKAYEEFIEVQDELDRIYENNG